jgi:DNA invertase Pin-like site-specific DNA recombinase
MRCAIYTRKSSEEGLEQEFNSLHAQREACELYAGSQRAEGWTLVGDHYDDGGFTGGTLEGVKKLLRYCKMKCWRMSQLVSRYRGIPGQPRLMR